VESVAAACSEDWKECTKSQCCQNANMQCYMQSISYARCMDSCSPYQDGGWTCNVVTTYNHSTAATWPPCHWPSDTGTKSIAPRRSPSIFCWAVVCPGTAEPELMTLQYKQQSGIFACDDYAVVSNVSADDLFPDPEMKRKIKVSIIHVNMWVKMEQMPPTAAVPNPPRHLVNSPIFIKAWQKIAEDQDYSYHDWTLKLDVDAFVVPGRLQQVLRVHPVKKAAYLLNTGVDMYSNFLHGPVEALNTEAVQRYAAHVQTCLGKTWLWKTGEDVYLNNCLKELDIHPIRDLTLMNDAYNWGGHYIECGSAHAVFHPLKTKQDWIRCLRTVCGSPSKLWGHGMTMKLSSNFSDASIVSNSPGNGFMTAALILPLPVALLFAAAALRAWKRSTAVPRACEEGEDSFATLVTGS